MADKITKVEIVTRKNKFEELKNALNEIGVMGMTVSQVLGCALILWKNAWPESERLHRLWPYLKMQRRCFPG